VWRFLFGVDVPREDCGTNPGEVSARVNLVFQGLMESR